MMRYACIAFIATALPVFAAPVPKEVKNEGKLEGTWKVVSLVTNGAVNNVGEDSYWTIDSEGVLTLHQGATAPAVVNKSILFKYNAGTKAIDYTAIAPNRNYPGVYELKGDSLKFCFNLKDQDRPKEIASGLDLNLWTFTRVKGEEKK